MKLSAARYQTPGRGTCDALQARLTGVAAPTLADLEGAALGALQAAGMPFETLEPGAGFRRHPRRNHAHLWVIANAGTGTSGRPWLQVSAGDPKDAGGVDKATFVWCSWRDHPGAALSPGELAQAQVQIEAQAQAAAERLREARERAREQAAREWEAASPDGADAHPYLVRKRVAALGVRVAGTWLLVPVRDAAGVLHSLQRIGPDAAKRFTTGGEVTGHFHLIGDPTPEGRLYLTEGYATGATVHQATGAPVAVCFNCGNLLAVAHALRNAYPRASLIVVGDNDAWTDGNPGATHARAAAEAVGAALVLPQFRDTATHPTDFNDLAQAEGIEAVRAQLVALPAATPRALATGVTLICGDAIRLEPIAWLWDGWLARGKVHVLAGAPGTGKTTATLTLAATLTTGGRWPDGTRSEVGSVVIWSGEDDPRDTLAPRLVASGADMRLVRFVASMTDEDGPRPFDPATDTEALADALADMVPPPGLLIVDPIVSAVAADSHKNGEVRRALQPLVELAQVRRCAVLGISHFTKGTAGRDPTERVTGSLAFGALARVVLATAKLPDEDGGGRILARAKNNLGADSGGFRYELEPLELPGHPGIVTTRVLWGEALDGTARELLGQAEAQGDPEERGALEDARGFLSAMLADGPMGAKQIKREASEAGHSERTLWRAKKALGVEARKEGVKGPWLWYPPPKAARAAEGCQGLASGTDQHPLAEINPGEGQHVEACHTPPHPGDWQPLEHLAALGPDSVKDANPGSPPPSPAPGDRPPATPNSPVVVEVEL